MKGLVIKSTGNIFSVKGEDGVEYSVRVKGKLRLNGCRSTSPVVVGDVVEHDGESVVSVDERKNYIIRRASNLSKESQVLAANLDQAVLIVTLAMPETQVEFIDRFLVTAYAYRVPVVIVFNKVDLYEGVMKEMLDAYISLYQGELGYRCIAISATEGTGMDQLKETLKGKITLVSGNSGVGKSTIINSLDNSFKTKTGAISDVHLTGMHTTTYSEMFPYEGGYVIDTPGIKGFGTIDMEAGEISHFFPEIFEEGKKCKFADCTHTKEPGCSVIKAVRDGLISESRYCSYLSIMEDASQGKYR